MRNNAPRTNRGRWVAIPSALALAGAGLIGTSLAANAANDPIDHPEVSFDVHCESSHPDVVESFDTTSRLILTAPTEVEPGESVDVQMAPSLDRETPAPLPLNPGAVVATVTADVVQGGTATSTFDSVGENEEQIAQGEIVGVDQAEGTFTAPTELGEFTLVAQSSVITVLGQITLTCEGSNPEDDPTITTLEVVEPGGGDEGGTEEGSEVGDDAGTEEGSDDGTEVGDDAGTEEGSEDGTDVGTEVGDDAGTEEGSDDGTDVGTEVGDDAGTEEGSDDGTESGTEEGAEAGSDDGAEAGTEKGTDDGKDNGTAAGDESGDGEPLPDTGMSPIAMVVGLLLIGAGAVVAFARRRVATKA